MCDRSESKNNLLKLLNIWFIFLIFCNLTVSVSCQQKKESIETSLKQCQAFLDKDDVVLANDCYDKAITEHPKSENEILDAREKTIFAKCKELRFEKRDYEKAITCFQIFANLLPNFPEAYIFLADSYHVYNREFGYKTGDTVGRAEAAAKKAVELRPESALAHEKYGRILEWKGDWERALKEYQQTIKLEPNDFSSWLALAHFQDKMGKTNEAIENYEQTLKLAPQNPFALYFVGKAYEKVGRIAQAIESYENLLKIEAEHYDAKQRLEKLKKNTKTK